MKARKARCYFSFVDDKKANQTSHACGSAIHRHIYVPNSIKKKNPLLPRFAPPEVDPLKRLFCAVRTLSFGCAKEEEMLRKRLTIQDSFWRKETQQVPSYISHT